ncbi:MAG: 3-oxoacyl-[acyl-carrier protein] reductase [Actinomycetota bacterium]|jgi:gluconate 5-dehydrogenase/3-oxoacyl-[acyl-carrier protein] reductase|nr:3-oxoacyl-[acyl-carrier protein] reductase [Actinomycetota bacterium]
MTDRLGIAGNQVLIAGATGRVGRALAGAFAALGANLIIHTFTREALACEFAEELAAKHGVKVLAVQGNILDPAEIGTLCDKLEADGLRALDVVVNCVTGFHGRPAGVHDLDVAEFRKVIDTDLVGCFVLAKACLPLLARAEHPTLILFSSLAGVRGRPGAVHLCAAKAGIIGMTRSLAMDLYSSGIRVNAVAPGPVRDMDASEGFPMPQGAAADVVFSSPDDVANVAIFLASRLSASVNGQVLSVNGGRV